MESKMNVMDQKLSRIVKELVKIRLCSIEKHTCRISNKHLNINDLKIEIPASNKYSLGKKYFGYFVGYLNLDNDMKSLPIK